MAATTLDVPGAPGAPAHGLGAVLDRELVPEGLRGRRYRYSPWSLRFLKQSIEREYLAYRNPAVLRYLRWLLTIGAVLIFAGSFIDFMRLDESDAILLTRMRIVAALGTIVALWMTRLEWVKAHLQIFIACGLLLVHAFWLASVPVIGDRIDEYDGLLPINIMMTFLVSGLLFCWARLLGLFAAAAYALTLLAAHPAPAAPILYLALASVYACFAAYVAERARREAWADAQVLDAERARSERLLLNVLPPSIAQRMKDGEDTIADRFDQAAVLFADIVGFTRMSSSMDPAELVHMLDEIFTRFDAIVSELDLEKIKTIGDCYMLACGLPAERRQGDERVAEAALRMQAAVRDIARRRGQPLDVRIGIHCGPVVAGVIGDAKFIYDLWGDTVNVASRMESTAPEGQIQISGALRERLQGFRVEERGEVELKGKGLQRTWLLKGREAVAPV